MTAGLVGDGVTVTVEVAFATANPLTTSPTWTDVSAYARAISIRRGRWSETSLRYDAGTCIVTFDNTDRRFDPLHATGAYYPNVLPMKQIRVQAVYSATTYDLFRGFIDEWPQTWTKGNPSGLGSYAETTVTATDAFGWLANLDVPDRYALEVLTDDPLAYWRCDDPRADLHDSGPSGVDGAWSGNTQSDQALRAQAQGSRNLLGYTTLAPITVWGESTGSAGNSSAVTWGDVTLEAWVQIGTATRGYVQALDPAGVNGVCIVCDAATYGVGSILFTWANQAASDAGWLGVVVGPGLHHVVGGYDDDTGAVSFWIDGVDYSVNSVLNFTDFVSIQELARGLFIFNANAYDADNLNTQFVVSDVAVYGSVLSSARIVQHWLAGKTGMKIEKTGARIGAILDYCDWPSGLRTLGDGDSYLDEGPVPSGLLDYLQQVAETEQGRLFMSGAGSLIFRDRTDDMTRSTSITSQATFGDSGSELRYADLILDGGNVNSIRNEIEVSPQSGSAATVQVDRAVLVANNTVNVTDSQSFLALLTQGVLSQQSVKTFGTQITPRYVSSTVRNDASITAYGRRKEGLTSLHYSQGDARNLGLWRLDKFASPTIVARQLTVQPRRSPTTLFPQVLGREIGDRITVTRRPQNVGTAISQARIVEGVQHEITPDNWMTTWYLCAPVDSYSEGNWHRVGDATYGKVGTAALPY